MAHSLSRSLPSLLLLLSASVCCLVLSSSTTTTAVLASGPTPPPVFPTWPFVLHTGPYSAAADAAFAVLSNPTTSTPALDAVVAGCSQCETTQCGGEVGFGGSPDENGETTLDAMIVDGVSLEMGAVGGLRGVQNAIGVARAVMEYTRHTMLVGDQASEFALAMGFPSANLTTPASQAAWQTWSQAECQPNFRQNVSPDPTKSCGPYAAAAAEERAFATESTSNPSHRARPTAPTPDVPDIAMIVIDLAGNMAAGTSSNGVAHKVPGRVGDAPIAGAGAWVDSDWGGCGATGDGDIMMRFAPCYQAVQNLRAGHTPRQAAEDALGRIERFFDFQGALVVIDREGNYGAAAWGMPFQFTIRTGQMNATEVVTINPGDWLHTKPMGHGNRRNKGPRQVKPMP